MQIVRIETVERVAVHRVDRAVGVNQNGTAPDMIATPQIRRSHEGLKGTWIEPLNPAEGGRAREGGHGAAYIPLLPPTTMTSLAPFGRRHRGGALGCSEASDCRFLAPIPAALHRPGRGLYPAPGQHSIGGEMRHVVGPPQPIMLSGCVVSPNPK